MSALAILSLVKRFWPYAVGALVVIALAFAVIRYGNSREREGAEGERVKWQAEAAKQAAIAVTLAQERQAETDRADDLGAQNGKLVDALAEAKRPEVRTYYAQNPSRNVACLGADRLRDIAQSDAAAYAAAKAAK